MTAISNIENIRKPVQILQECGNDFGLMEKATDDMYSIFSAITGTTIHHLNEDKDRQQDLLAINSASLDKLNKAVETLAIDNCIGEIYNSDAADFKISRSYNIVISKQCQNRIEFYTL